MRIVKPLLRCAALILLGATPSFAQPYQAETILLVPANTSYPISIGEVDPPCHHWEGNKEVKGVECVPVCVIVPRAAKGLEPQISVKETGDLTWFVCPTAPGF